MKVQDIDWTNLLKKYYMMDELTFDSFINGTLYSNNDIEEYLDDETMNELSNYSEKEENKIFVNFFNKFTNKTKDGFVAENIIDKIIDALKINSGNRGFYSKIAGFIEIMPVKDSDKIKIAEEIKDEYAMARIIKTLSTDEAKQEAMKTIKDKYAKSIIIETFSTDDARINAISSIYNISLPEDYEHIRKIKLPPDMTIGCEIESEGKNSELLTNINLFGWKGKEDGSLQNGVEIVSPIMHSDEEDTQSIYKICDLLKKIKNDTSDRCGGHIHIGADYLKEKQAYANLLSIFGNTEELLYIIANDPKDITDRTTRYDSPISKKVQDAIESGIINLETEQDVNEFIKNLEKIQRYRYSGLNFWSYDEHRTIEFRLSNGTINPDAWVENINLFGGIIKAAEEISVIQKKPMEEMNKAEKNKLKLFEKIQKKDLKDKEKLEILLKLVIDKNDRDIYKNRYNKNSKKLSRKRKKEFKKGIANKPIKVSAISTRVFNENRSGSGSANIVEVGKSENVVNTLEKNKKIENNWMDK